jgi:hypothetical protein
VFNESEDRSTRQTAKQQPPPTCIDIFTLKHAPNSVSNSQVEQAKFISDLKSPLAIPPREMAVAENVESQLQEPTHDSRNPSFDPNSEDVLHRQSSSAANSLTPSESTTTTARQQCLLEQEQARAIRLASLETRAGSAGWVFGTTAGYDAMAAEMSQLRAEVAWLRDVQQSDRALGLSDEILPPYSKISKDRQ